MTVFPEDLGLPETRQVLPVLSEKEMASRASKGTLARHRVQAEAPCSLPGHYATGVVRGNGGYGQQP